MMLNPHCWSVAMYILLKRCRIFVDIEKFRLKNPCFGIQHYGIIKKNVNTFCDVGLFSYFWPIII